MSWVSLSCFELVMLCCGPNPIHDDVVTRAYLLDHGTYSFVLVPSQHLCTLRGCLRGASRIKCGGICPALTAFIQCCDIHCVQWLRV